MPRIQENQRLQNLIEDLIEYPAHLIVEVWDRNIAYVIKKIYQSHGNLILEIEEKET